MTCSVSAKSLVRGTGAVRWGSRGRRFKSCRPARKSQVRGPVQEIRAGPLRFFDSGLIANRSSSHGEPDLPGAVDEGGLSVPSPGAVGITRSKQACRIRGRYPRRCGMASISWHLS